jgi:hypothetical protein
VTKHQSGRDISLDVQNALLKSQIEAFHCGVTKYNILTGKVDPYAGCSSKIPLPLTSDPEGT